MRFAVYLSHSWWASDVDLNVKVWAALAADSELLVDAPEESGADPPYYINRVEELLRRTDLFVSVLTYRPPKDANAKLKCSPYSLFEIHLAERADIPRLVLYDRRTGFKPSGTERPWAAYQVFERAMGERLPEQGQWARVVEPRIRRWQEWIMNHRKPASYELSTESAILMDRREHAELASELESCLDGANFTPRFYDVENLRSSDALRQLRQAGLLVVEFGSQPERLAQLYAAAHGIGIPAVRLLRTSETALPWILDGESGGYREDLVRWDSLEQATALAKPRIEAMLRLSPALSDSKASEYLQSKRYAKFFVFVSHSLKDSRRKLVERVCEELAKRNVASFEYHQVNRTGIDWKAALERSLQKTTHFIALLTPDYEQSPYCTYEIEQVLQRKNEVRVLPFMASGRTTPHPKLGEIHNTLLGELDVEANARMIVDQVMLALEEAVRAAAVV
jgi:hypothetical protein